MEKIRLQIYLARSGLAPSRRKAEELIKAGKIFVNGKAAILGTKVDAQKDKITIAGEKVSAITNKIYIILNKPVNYLVAKSDLRGRKLAFDLLKQPSTNKERLSEPEFNSLFNVGRLDLNTEGLLIFTNDGAFADAIIHPRKRINKTYIAKIEGKISDESLNSLLSGVEVVAEQDDKEVRYLSRFRNIRLLGRGKYSILVIKISEGKKRQVRRTLETVGHKVLSLKRIAIGSLQLDNLPLGKWRFLDNKELQCLVELN